LAMRRRESAGRLGAWASASRAWPPSGGPRALGGGQLGLRHRAGDYQQGGRATSEQRRWAANDQGRLLPLFISTALDEVRGLGSGGGPCSLCGFLTLVRRPVPSAQRAERTQPRAEAARPMPWEQRQRIAARPESRDFLGTDDLTAARSAHWVGYLKRKSSLKL
jgi:hypothetical protein